MEKTIHFSGLCRRGHQSNRSCFLLNVEGCRNGGFMMPLSKSDKVVIQGKGYVPVEALETKENNFPASLYSTLI